MALLWPGQRKKRKVGLKRSVKKTDIELPGTEPSTPPETTRSSLFTRKNFFIIVILLIAFLAWRFKGLFIAATVNGQPISRFELNRQLNQRFGEQVLDNIINERLIIAATRESGIFVTPQELDARVATIEANLAGQATLTDALEVQGLTPQSFRRQLEIQIAIEKLFTTESTIAAQEIEDYISNNETFYKDATNPAALREEVKATLVQQKINEIFEPWFSQIRDSASIKTFIQ